MLGHKFQYGLRLVAHIKRARESTLFERRQRATRVASVGGISKTDQSAEDRPAKLLRYTRRTCVERGTVHGSCLPSSSTEAGGGLSFMCAHGSCAPSSSTEAGGCLSFMSSIGALVDLSFGTGVTWVTPHPLQSYPVKRAGRRRVPGIQINRIPRSSLEWRGLPAASVLRPYSVLLFWAAGPL